MSRYLRISLFFVCVFSYVLLIEGRPQTIVPESHGAQDDIETEEKQTETQTGQTFYRWTDDEGNLFFTDDPIKVPERFRTSVETLELPPLPEVKPDGEEGREPVRDESPPPLPATPREDVSEMEDQRRISRDPYAYKEIPFDQFIRITVGMDEAEVLSRLGFPTLITPSDYFYGDRARYRSRIIRFIYLGERARNQKTTIVEIRDGKVINTERIFP
jgi:hypothetical protein